VRDLSRTINQPREAHTSLPQASLCAERAFAFALARAFAFALACALAFALARAFAFALAFEFALAKS